jgi:5-dehydro-2-deoxygluconokinase
VPAVAGRTDCGPGFAGSARWDVACIGRVAVDLYANEVGVPLARARTFSMYVGGSSGNVAIGVARLGLRSAMISRVSADELGDFVVQTLAAEGVDARGVRRDPRRLTGLVVLGVQPPDRFPLIFYRENCADIHLAPADLDGDLIAASRLLHLTGTCLSREPSRTATLRAIRLARRAGRLVSLDLDYRPGLWPEGPGVARVQRAYSARMLAAAPDVDLVVGTEEEFAAATGARDPVRAMARMRARTGAVLVLKRGARGSEVLAGDERIVARPYPVQVLNVLGAGDGYASGLLFGWLSGWSWSRSASFANAVGAIVVTRHGCSPAIPTRTEVEAFLADRGERASPPSGET